MRKKNLRYFLPNHMTREHEKHIDAISARLLDEGWREDFVREWWQTPMHELNGFCPLEAVCADKFDLAQRCLDKTLRLYADNAHAERERVEKILQS